MFLLALTARAWDYETSGEWPTVCSQVRQSPIDVKNVQVDPGRLLYFSYPPFTEPVRLYATGHALAVTFPDWYKAGFADSSAVGMSLDDSFRLRQLTVHSPGEHRFNGAQPGIEVQFMHEQGPRVAGIAVSFVGGGLHNNFIAVLLERLPTEPFQEVVVNDYARWEFEGLLVNASFDAYEGSLTIPPCDPVVEWYVRSVPIAIAHDQLRALERAVQKIAPGGNARAPQPVEGRPVTQIFAHALASGVTMDHLANMQAPVAIAEPPPLNAPDILNNPAFKAILPDDSPELAAAKTKLSQFAQDADAARVATIQAKQFLDQQQNLYDNAPGPVEKMSLLWQVIAGRDGFAGAIAARTAADRAYKQAIDEVLAVVETEMEQVMQSGNSTMTSDSFDLATQDLLRLQAASQMFGQAIEADVAPAENATAASGTTSMPTALPGKVLEYTPKIVPFSDEAASPFDPLVAERAPRIGTKPAQQQRQYARLSESLKQPAAPKSVADKPRLVPLPTSPPASNATNATNATNVTANATANATANVTAPATAPANGTVPQVLAHPRLRAARRAQGWWER